MSSGIIKSYFIIIFFGLLLYLPGLSTIPPTDRDEGTYAQVSKQMLESRDFLTLKFQDALFNTKPPGMYWSQALSTQLLSSASSNEIWPYRIPSTLALIIASILLFILFKDIFDDRVALLAALIFETNFHSVLEAHIAKADSLLLLATIIVQGLLCKVICKAKTNIFDIFLIWFFIGIGILIKGPVLPAVFILTIMSYSLLEKDYKLILKLKPVFGFAICSIVVLPWCLIFYNATSLSFAKESFLRDILPRLISQMENHGGYPGFYVLFSMLSFWPWSLFIYSGLYILWQNREDPRFKFLLCWLVPAWLCLEIIPTKLPNYVFPLYPALSLGVASYLSQLNLINSIASKLNSYIWLIFSLIFAYALFNFENYIDRTLSISSILILFIMLSVAVLVVINRNNKQRLTYLMFSALLVLPILYGLIIPNLENLHLTPKLKKSLDNKFKAEDLVFTGYREPSLVFLLGKEIKIKKNGEEAAKVFLENCNKIAVVNDKEQQAFLNLASQQAKLNLTVDGYDYTHFRWTTLYLYQHQDC